MLMALAIVFGACGASGGSDQQPTASSSRRPQTKGFAGATVNNLDFLAQAIRSLITGTPLYNADFADPFVYREGGDYWAYATNTEDAHVPVLSSTGGGVVDALPVLPEWTTEGFIWSPAVARIGDHMVLYYATAMLGRMCISVAVGDNPDGPFVDRSEEPLICPYDDGGAIDPSPYQVNGRWYLTWKVDGNCCELPTSILAAELSDDGTALSGDPVTLIGADQAWEGGLVEAPSMTSLQGNLVLAYSANAWDSEDYGVGAATCAGPLGPCTKLDGPFLKSGGEFQGPGGEEWFVSALGDTMLVFHGWPEGEVSNANVGRHLYLEVVEWDNGPKLVGKQRAQTVVFITFGSTAIVLLAILLLFRQQRARRRNAELRAASQAGPSA